MQEADSVLDTSMDISKLKVPDLKRELKSRGLSTSGNKNDLVERLQGVLLKSDRPGHDSVDDLEEDLLNEDDDDHLETTGSEIGDIDSALNDTLPVTTPKGLKRKSSDSTNGESNKSDSKPIKKVVLDRDRPMVTPEVKAAAAEKEDENKSNGTLEPKKVIKLTEVSSKERLEMRAKKFESAAAAAVGATDDKKTARAARFGITNNATTSNSKISASVPSASVDVLKQRAERFGGSVSKVMSNLELQERMEKRKARFGIVTSDDKAKQRLERFKSSN